MAVSSLTRMTVPLASDQSASAQGLLMPKLKYRFRVTLDQFGVPGAPTTEMTKQVMTVSRPELTFDDITLDGLLYDGYNWHIRFTSQADLNIIKAWKAREELEEIIYMLKKSATT